jgi:hypothetical protein
MAQPNTPLLIPRKAQLGIIEYNKYCIQAQASQLDIREKMRKIDLAYQREEDLTLTNTRAKAANRYGDSDKIQNITVPVVLPQVEAAVTYQSSVFLQGHPIFGVVSNPSSMDAAVQMETVIEDQATRGGWVRQFMLMFRDGFKYNLAAAEVTWDRYVTAALETDLTFSPKQAKPKEVIWEGNCINRIDPYNLIFDSRVTPTELHSRGEYAGYVRLMSRIELKSFINSLQDKILDNVTAAFESSVAFTGTDGQGTYYTPSINSSAIVNANNTDTTNWMSWAGIANQDNKIQYKDMYELTTLYARILPSDFGIRVPSANTPQVWKFYIVNNSVLIYAERQTNAHNNLPILLSQPLEDGLGYQTKPLSTNVQPIQDITSAFWNSILASRRRAVSDRGLYDPSRVAEHHINSASPTAKIPVRPSAYGKPLSEAYYPIPFRDDQSAILLQETQSLMQMANVISGQNQVRQGQFVKGNKTLHEFQSVMSNANGRDQLTSMLLEAQFFTPLKEILKINILQYQGGVSLYSRDKDEVVTIDPVKLRKSVLDFKITDGLLPTDKMINADTLQVAMQVIGSSPEIGSRYNIGPLFSYFMKTQGAKITEFEKSPEQIAYEQAVQAWQQAMAAFGASLKGMEPMMVQQMMQQMPPQPTPEQFGYKPGAENLTAPQNPVENRIYNIQNNITNNKEQ